MGFDIVALTDIGVKKKVNQDSVGAWKYETPSGEAVFAIVCDGMGGLTHGEMASRMIVSAFSQWCGEALPGMSFDPSSDSVIREQWTRLIVELNTKIRNLGVRGGYSIGSTVTAALFIDRRYFIMNIGDSRAYEIGSDVRQITVDHTVIEREIRLGNMTSEQAELSPVKSVLTKCVGVAPNVYPDMFFGVPEKKHIFLLCSDGFRHRISVKEIYRGFAQSGKGLEESARNLVELNKARGETDNVSVVVVLVN